MASSDNKTGGLGAQGALPLLPLFLRALCWWGMGFLLDRVTRCRQQWGASPAGRVGALCPRPQQAPASGADRLRWSAGPVVSTQASPGPHLLLFRINTVFVGQACHSFILCISEQPGCSL